MSVRLKRGFTIVELLMVVAIIAVLITMTVSAISGSMRQARYRKASALCTLVEQGIATYYAQKDEWPITLENKSLNADVSGSTSAQNKEVYLLTASEVREMVKQVVEQTRQNNPMMDVSGLFVSTVSGESGTRGYGMDFLTAIHGTKQSPRKIKLAQMYFGYPDPTTGYFRRFRMTYSPATDKVTVLKP